MQWSSKLIRLLIAFIFLLIGLIGLIICNHLSTLPQAADVGGGYISPFHAGLNVIYPGLAFLIFLGIISMIPRLLFKIIPLVIGSVVFVAYTDLIMFGSGFCIDGCDGYDYQTVQNIVDRIVSYEYFIAILCILIIILPHITFIKKQTKTFAKKR